MKKYLFFSAVIALLTLHACQSDSSKTTEDETNANNQAPAKQETPAKMIELLVGEWQLDNAGNAGQQAVAGDRLTFTEEARYIARSGGQKVDSGAFRMNEQLRSLYLESEASKQPREYEFTLAQDVMTLTPKQNAQGTTKLTYRRAGPASISPQKTGEQ